MFTLRLLWVCFRIATVRCIVSQEWYSLTIYCNVCVKKPLHLFAVEQWMCCEVLVSSCLSVNNVYFALFLQNVLLSRISTLYASQSRIVFQKLWCTFWSTMWKITFSLSWWLTCTNQTRQRNSWMNRSILRIVVRRLPICWRSATLSFVP